MGVNINDNKFVTTETNTFHLIFDLPKNVDKNLKHEIEFFIKCYESLADHEIKKEIGGLLYKYKHGNNIHQHRKQ